MISEQGRACPSEIFLLISHNVMNIAIQGRLYEDVGPVRRPIDHSFLSAHRHVPATDCWWWIMDELDNIPIK